MAPDCKDLLLANVILNELWFIYKVCVDPGDENMT